MLKGYAGLHTDVLNALHMCINNGGVLPAAQKEIVWTFSAMVAGNPAAEVSLGIAARFNTTHSLHNV